LKHSSSAFGVDYLSKIEELGEEWVGEHDVACCGVSDLPRSSRVSRTPQCPSSISRSRLEICSGPLRCGWQHAPGLL
jgi:hypothetical protein